MHNKKPSYPPQRRPVHKPSPSVAGGPLPRDQSLLAVIRQYLHAMGYQRAWDILKTERPSIQRRTGVMNGGVGNNISNSRVEVEETSNGGPLLNARQLEVECRNIVGLFERGARQEFLKAANKILVGSWCNQRPNSVLGVNGPHVPVNQNGLMAPPNINLVIGSQNSSVSSNNNSNEEMALIQTLRRLQFQLHVYFCIYCIHPVNSKRIQKLDNPSVQAFKKYLELKGHQLSNSSQYLNFFALHYMPRPQEHPGVSYVFTRDWVNKLKVKLNDILKQWNDWNVGQLREDQAAQVAKKPQCALLEMYDLWRGRDKSSTSTNSNSNSHNNSISSNHAQQHHPSSSRQQPPSGGHSMPVHSRPTSSGKPSACIEHERVIAELTEQCQGLYTYVQTLQQHYKSFAQSSKFNLIESNKKWFNFAKQLMVMTKKASRGERIPIDKYEGFFGKNVQDLIYEDADVSLFDKNSYIADQASILIGGGGSKNRGVLDSSHNMGAAKDRQSRGGQNDRGRNGAPTIDMQKIKQFLMEANNQSKVLEICLVLKALKKRLNSARTRRQVVVEYMRHDLCGMKPENKQLQKRLLFQSIGRCREFYLHLLNRISLDFQGIKYLMAEDLLIQNLLAILSQINLSDPVSEYVLAVIQRLSYFKVPRVLMISMGILPTIYAIFRQDRDKLEITEFQYLLSALMNLSLDRSSKIHHEKHKSELITLTAELMTHQNSEIRQHTNGILYLVVGSSIIREQALKQGLDRSIERLMETISTENDRRWIQYKYILERLVIKERISSSDDQDEDQDQDQDQFEDDTSLSDDSSPSQYIEDEENMITGQQLLVKQFALLGPEAVREKVLNKSMLDQSCRKGNNVSVSISHSRRLDNIFNRPATP